MPAALHCNSSVELQLQRIFQLNVQSLWLLHTPAHITVGGCCRSPLLKASQPSEHTAYPASHALVSQRVLSPLREIQCQAVLPAARQVHKPSDQELLQCGAIASTSCIGSSKTKGVMQSLGGTHSCSRSITGQTSLSKAGDSIRGQLDACNSASSRASSGQHHAAWEFGPGSSSSITGSSARCHSQLGDPSVAHSRCGRHSELSSSQQCCKGAVFNGSSPGPHAIASTPKSNASKQDSSATADGACNSGQESQLRRRKDESSKQQPADARQHLVNNARQGGNSQKQLDTSSQSRQFARGSSNRRRALMKSLARTTPTRAPNIPAAVTQPQHSGSDGVGSCSKAQPVNLAQQGGTLSEVNRQNKLVQLLGELQKGRCQGCMVPPVSLLVPDSAQPLPQGIGRPAGLVTEPLSGGSSELGHVESLTMLAEQCQAGETGCSTSCMHQQTYVGADAVAAAVAKTRAVRRSLLAHPEFC